MTRERKRKWPKRREAYAVYGKVSEVLWSHDPNIPLNVMRQVRAAILAEMEKSPSQRAAQHIGGLLDEVLKVG